MGEFVGVTGKLPGRGGVNLIIRKGNKPVANAPWESLLSKTLRKRS